MRKLTICETPLEQFTLVLPREVPPAVRTAADFLLKTFEKSCGVKLPVSESAPEHGIYLGTCAPCDAVKWDGFRVRTDDRSLYLDGNIPRGTLYAAYDFAERYLGYRSFAPDTEVLSSDGCASLPSGTDRIDNPSFQERLCDWYAFSDPELASRFRVFSLSDSVPEEYGGSDAPAWSCHSMGSLCSADLYYDQHPEYYALVDGQRIPCRNGGGPGQLCLTNPDVLRIVTDNVLAQLRKNPLQRCVEVSHCDNGNYCRCERCAAVDEEEGSHSGTMIRFVNAVAEAVEKEFPDVLVRTFAYEYTIKPPKITKARKNVLIRYCTYDTCFRHGIDDPNCKVNRETTYPEILGWKEKSSQLCIWDYVTNWDCFLAPFPNLVSLRENARFFADSNVTSVFEEDQSSIRQGGMHPELKSYLIGKLLWNARMSEEEYRRHIDEFLEAYYGPGWKSVRRVIEIEHETTGGRCFGCKEELDICFVHYVTYPPIPGIKQFLRQNYRACAFQPILPNHALTEFCTRIEECRRLFGEAREAARTDLQREHIRRSEFSLDYPELFCTPHNRSEMSQEEQDRYLEAVQKFYEDKKEYGMYFNLSSSFTKQ
ncbi:MAG: DUF4838 domain-containing protein [Clostridia bacterium]|nr:DUF4838 domain-containing protein [Clostridia bacterium]